MRTPGDYILLQVSGRPDWPAVICTDDMAPLSLSRPNGYMTLVLLIQKELTFRYATTTEMRYYEPSVSIDNEDNMELQYAHDQVLNAMFSGDSSLDYWRWKTKDQRQCSRLPNPSPIKDPYLVDEEWCKASVEEQKWILAQFEAKARERRSMSIPSSPPCDSKRQARAIPHFPLAKEPPGDLRNHFRSVTQDRVKESDKHVLKRRKREELDYIDGELLKSSSMVQFLVGKEQEPFLIPKAEVDKRPYLSNPQIGCVRTMDDGTFRADMQCLERFDPQDFHYVAEFLSTGQFGQAVIDDGNRAEAIAECAAAWDIGDRIVMEDLLEHIAVKLQQVSKWDLEEAWFFARIVYRQEGTPLDGHLLMKETLAKTMVENYHEMIRRHGANFTDHLRKMPELERDIYKRLLEKAEESCR